MTQKTSLSTIATPGKTQSFSAKDEAAVVPKGVGPFTQMSVMALPGRIHAFAAKDEAVVVDVIKPLRRRAMAALIKSRHRRKC